MFIVTVSVNIGGYVPTSTNRNSVRSHLNTAPQVYSLQRQTEHRRTSAEVYTASHNQPMWGCQVYYSGSCSAAGCWLSITLTRPETDRKPAVRVRSDRTLVCLLPVGPINRIVVCYAVSGWEQHRSTVLPGSGKLTFMTFVFFVSLNLWNSYSLYRYAKHQIT